MCQVTNLTSLLGFVFRTEYSTNKTGLRLLVVDPEENQPLT
jgi:hypothetical protein